MIIFWRISYIYTMMRIAKCSYSFARDSADAWIESFGILEYSGSEAAIEEMSCWEE